MLSLLLLASSMVSGTPADTIGARPQPEEAVVDSLSLEPSIDLEEITVMAKKDLVKSDGRKLTYDVENDPTRQGNSVMEMLRKVPMVTVDGEDNIKVMGQSGFKIYVNGKEDPMLSGNPSEVLKAMPANTVKSIEVITDPGAKYSAEGVGGILNIVMDRGKKQEGYLATVSAGFSSYGYNASLYGRTKTGNVTMSLNAFMNDMSLFTPAYLMDSDTERFDSADERFQRSHMRQTSKHRVYGGNYNLSWEPDAANLFTFTAGLFSFSQDADAQQDLEFLFPDLSLSKSWKRNFTTDKKDLSANGSLSYMHTFANADNHTLTLTYTFNYNDQSSHSCQRSFDYHNFDGYREPYMNNNSLTGSFYHTIQGDYVLPIRGTQTFEAGFKLNLRTQRGDSWLDIGPQSDDMHLDSRMKVNQGNNVYAAYATYSAQIGSLTAKGGLRYEHNRLGLDYRYLFNSGDYSDFHVSLNDWVPDVSLTYSITPMSNLMLMYQMRINRPSLSQMNPYSNDMNYGEINTGNPDLKSQRNHNISLKYSNFGGKFSGQVGLSHNRSDNCIDSFQWVADDVLYTSYANLGHMQQTSLDGYLQYQITQMMSLGLNASLSYTDYRSESPAVHNSGWGGNAMLNYQYMMPKDFTLSVYGGIFAPSVGAQGSQNSWFNFMAFSLSKKLLKSKKLMLTLTANNPFSPRKTFRLSADGAGFKTEQRFRLPTWYVGLNVSYTLGGMNSDVKKTRQANYGDDIAAPKSNEPGSGGK